MEILVFYQVTLLKKDHFSLSQFLGIIVLIRNRILIFLLLKLVGILLMMSSGAILYYPSQTPVILLQ